MRPSTWLKSISVLGFAMALLFANGGSALADVPPEPGSLVTSEITGVAASILTVYLKGMDGKEQPFPAEIGPIRADGLELGASAVENRVFTKGMVGRSSDSVSSTTIGCVSYFNRGRNAKCRLVRKFK